MFLFGGSQQEIEQLIQYGNITENTGLNFVKMKCFELLR